MISGNFEGRGVKWVQVVRTNLDGLLEVLRCSLPWLQEDWPEVVHRTSLSWWLVVVNMTSLSWLLVVVQMTSPSWLLIVSTGQACPGSCFVQLDHTVLVAGSNPQDQPVLVGVLKKMAKNAFTWSDIHRIKQQPYHSFPYPFSLSLYVFLLFSSSYAF